jgi:16S rRNA (guanine(966)-N(2))-methyltransferase RsmD
MRIVAGKFKGRRLKTLKGSEVRPTADRVKESLFRIFGEGVVDADFLDLCAGTGSIGLEALSQGAGSATFVDNNYYAIRIIESNLEMCGFDRKHPQVRLIHLDARKALARLGKRKAQFDLIYFDPPYASKIHESCVKQIAEANLLSPDGVLVVEHGKVQEPDWTESLILDRLVLSRQERYGDTMLSFYKWQL